MSGRLAAYRLPLPKWRQQRRQQPVTAHNQSQDAATQVTKQQCSTGVPPTPVQVFIHAAGQQRHVAAIALHADQRQLHGLVLVGLRPAQQAQHMLAAVCKHTQSSAATQSRTVKHRAGVMSTSVNLQAANARGWGWDAQHPASQRLPLLLPALLALPALLRSWLRCTTGNSRPLPCLAAAGRYQPASWLLLNVVSGTTSGCRPDLSEGDSREWPCASNTCSTTKNSRHMCAMTAPGCSCQRTLLFAAKDVCCDHLGFTVQHVRLLRSMAQMPRRSTELVHYMRLSHAAAVPGNLQAACMLRTVQHPHLQKRRQALRARHDCDL